jgi:hypothetical protein
MNTKKTITTNEYFFVSFLIKQKRKLVILNFLLSIKGIGSTIQSPYIVSKQLQVLNFRLPLRVRQNENRKPLLTSHYALFTSQYSLPRP